MILENYLSHIQTEKFKLKDLVVPSEERGKRWRKKAVKKGSELGYKYGVHAGKGRIADFGKANKYIPKKVKKAITQKGYGAAGSEAGRAIGRDVGYYAGKYAGPAATGAAAIGAAGLYGMYKIYKKWKKLKSLAKTAEEREKAEEEIKKAKEAIKKAKETLAKSKGK